MPKIARFRRALVELNHQISNTRKRAARNREESRVFTQPLRLADICTLRSEGQLRAQSGPNQNLPFAPAASPSPCGIRNPSRNAAEKADFGASRCNLDRGYDRVVGRKRTSDNCPTQSKNLDRLLNRARNSGFCVT